MCGIWAVFGVEGETLNCVCNNFNNISHRGPDALRVEYDSRIKNAFLGFHRLAILDSLCGMQPMRLYKYPNVFLICNGEIYNFKQLRDKYNFSYSSKCDIEIITHLYMNGGAKNVVNNLDGVFAFCLMDMQENKVLIGRDPYGVRPLFRLLSTDGQLAVCSETKGLIGLTDQVTGDWTLEPFPPGHYEEYKILENGKVEFLSRVCYHKPGDKPSFDTYVPWNALVPTDVQGNIVKLFTGAIEKRLMADRRIGCLLSGGLDSSLVASLVVKLAKKHNLPYKVQTFAIGMGDSPDLRAARQVAQFIDSEHHEITFTEQDIADVLDNVIYTLETFDITTVRASVGMYLLAKYIKEKTSTTVIFSGEGADELAQGYIYFRDAPNPHDGHEESLRLLKDIYLYDGLRADRTTSAHSLELRVPFLDLQFTNYYLSLNQESRQPQNGVEKHLLRSAFDKENLLPNNILWRHKEAFSDGVASIKKSLFQIIQEIVESKVTDQDIETAHLKYPHCTPKTKESYYYRKMFEKNYPGQAESLIPYFWMPRWVKNITDPSARFIKHYAAEEDSK
ncbi:asparagine synthetase [glutamine-hydrolyzing] [Cotesia glomerata]|uniref:Asparagine synthetase [glutamine-hydrolyzing] n=1 Tax=Cotesia glomerata TaxID=32391 RepID=A0AAV7HVC7_COTGL|nr:asparagine synthetase [glutamine-hydrolyzing] [Cotesia glomerata]KAH0534292.1 hypothetical protein KQX54_002662 [Cotesia glomerata]